MASSSFTDSSWTGYFEVTSDNTKVDEATGDLMVDLGTHAPADFWSNVASDGSDVRITNSDGSTAYSFELENFDQSGQTGVLFFDSQNIQTGSDVTWRVYAGNGSASMPAVTDTLGAQNVWETDAEAIYHLEDVNDSTSNNHDGTTYGGMTVGGTDGNFGKATNFDGSDDYIDVGDFGFNDDESFTYIAWINLDTISGTQSVLATDQNRRDMEIFDDGHVHLEGWDGSDTNLDGSITLSSGNWAFVGIRFDGSTAYIYVNGSPDNSGGWGYSASDPPQMIGSYPKKDKWLDGLIGEVRIYKSFESQNWYNTHYNNQSDNANFWTAGSWQTTGPSAPSVLTSAVDNIKDTSGDGNGSIDSENGATPDERGFVFDTTSYSDPGNTSPSSSAYSNSVNETGSYSTGSYSLTMSGLTAGTKYYVRAYAHNSEGYSYGSEVSFRADEVRKFDTTNTDFSQGTHTNTEAENNNVELAGGTTTLTEGFESGSLDSAWTQTTNFNIKSDYAYGGSYSAGQDSDGSSADAIWAPSDLSGGEQVSKISFYWRELTDQTGVTFQFVDSSGNSIFEAGSKNPEWELDDGTGLTEIYANSGDYQVWIYFEFTFDWSAGTYDYYMEDMSDGHTESGTRDLSNNTDFEKLKINDSHSSWDSADHFWVDNIYTEYGESLATSGNYESDTLSTSPLNSVGDGTVSWNETLNGNSITIETNVSIDGGSTWQGWSTVSSGDSIPNIGDITDTSSGLVKYKASLSGDGSSTPELNDITLTVTYSGGTTYRPKAIMVH